MPMNFLAFVRHALPLTILSAALLCHLPTEATPNKKKVKKAVATKVNSKVNPKVNTKVVGKVDTRGEFANFIQWQAVGDFIDSMVSRHGFDKAQLQATLREAHFIDSAIKLIKPAPAGFVKNWQAYRARSVEPVRIRSGIQFWNQYADALARAEAQYGVPAEIIVGILGIETVYGKNTGQFRVMDVITTLAFAYPNTPKKAERSAFFLKQLEHTLLLARESNLDPFSLLGSYAGAIGWPQFMPGSIRQFAVDFDGDGKIDLRNSPVDAIGSIAHYLQQHGWRKNEPLVFPVSVWDTSNNALWQSFINQGLSAQNKLSDLQAAGISTPIEPPADLLYGLIDLQNGPEPAEYWLGTNNFFVITQYNRSYFYAMSVIELGRVVKNQRGQ
jgi:membrane-bound lytic murein transglycosylase B